MQRIKRLKPFFLHILRRWWWLWLLLLLGLFFWFSLPSPLFSDPCSTVIDDRNGNLLGARIAADEQWRFPPSSKVPYKFEVALTQFEDRYFRYHNGINPVSFSRALLQNIRARKIVSGGSTLTMQVIRLARKGKARTVPEKLVEAFLAVRLELTSSKDDIIALYASNAPFGSNVVGLDAAAWRYFGKKPGHLSWAEAATLAVLPNSPSLIYPGRNQDMLRKKRDALLLKIHQAKYITRDEMLLALNEPLPGKPYPLPGLCPHLIDRCIAAGYKGKRVTTTVDVWLQALAVQMVERYHQKYKANKVNNIAMLVLEVETGNALVYVGNTHDPGHPEYGCQVDVITAARSTGSILKPYLYSAMLHDGEILPNSLVADIPIQLGSFMPENYNYTFDGAVPAKRALSRSLNIPAVKMLQSYGTDRFYHFLKRIGITTLGRPASHYGLALILGGAEASLWDVTGAYAGMARILNHYSGFNSRYLKSDVHPPSFISKEHQAETGNNPSSVLSASAVYFTFEAMNEVSRPDEDAEWQQFSSSARVAWKTGTSFGGRDAWSVGVNPEYVVGVWVGNSDGEGRPGLTGLTYAAPLMFEMFKALKPKGWFAAPYDDMVRLPICRQSGYKASPLCENADTLYVPASGAKTGICPYHHLIHLDATGNFRVTADCEDIRNMIHRSWFVLPPVMEYFYRNKNPFYKVLPPYREDCQPDEGRSRSLEMIYPRDGSRIYVPVDVDGKREKVVFKAAHHTRGIPVFWYLDAQFAGKTLDFHQMAFCPDPGMHSLTLVDGKGENLTLKFEIVEKKKSN